MKFEVLYKFFFFFVILILMIKKKYFYKMVIRIKNDKIKISKIKKRPQTYVVQSPALLEVHFVWTSNLTSAKTASA